MMLLTIAKMLDFLTISFVFGATLWFFFIQTPLLLKKMGRERFVPLQMKLAQVLFFSLTPALAVTLVAALYQQAPGSPLAISALVALLSSATNQLFVMPRALRAGGRGLRDARGKDAEASTAAFASEGVGGETKVLHRMLVALVVVMLAALVTHIYQLLVPIG